MTTVINGLVEIVQDRYADHQLVSEEEDAMRADQNLVSEGERIKPSDIDALETSKDPAIRALFREESRLKQADRALVRNSCWEEVATVNAKRAAAAYVKALETIKEGHNKLASQASDLRAKDVASLIQPYTDSLSKLIPSL